MRFHPILAREYEAGDLLQMAVLAALQATRKWPKERVDFVKFLAEAMRSIASNESRKLWEGSQAHLVSEHEIRPRGAGQGETGNPESVVATAPSPEQTMLHAEKDAEGLAKLALLKAQLAHDQEISRIFELQLEGLSKWEIRERLGMDSTRFWTADRRLSRHIEQIIERLRNYDS